MPAAAWRSCRNVQAPYTGCMFVAHTAADVCLVQTAVTGPVVDACKFIYRVLQLVLHRGCRHRQGAVNPAGCTWGPCKP